MISESRFNLQGEKRLKSKRNRTSEHNEDVKRQHKTRSLPASAMPYTKEIHLLLTTIILETDDL
jgi:hypothetical protein